MAMRVGLKSSRRTLALEPRLLFDGAGAAAGADALMDGDAPDLVDAPEQGEQPSENGIDPTEVSSFDEDETEDEPGVNGNGPDTDPNADPETGMNAGEREDEGDDAPFMPMGFAPMSNGEGDPADVTVEDKVADRGRAVSVGEHSAREGQELALIGEGIEISGDDTYRVTFSVGYGELSLEDQEGSFDVTRNPDGSITVEGNAEAITDAMKSLLYGYTGDSQVGDEDR